VPSLFLNVFTVASPSIMAATMSPFSARLLPHDHPVPVGDSSVDHRVARDLEKKSVPSPTAAGAAGKTSSTDCSRG